MRTSQKERSLHYRIQSMRKYSLLHTKRNLRLLFFPHVAEGFSCLARFDGRNKAACCTWKVVDRPSEYLGEAAGRCEEDLAVSGSMREESRLGRMPASFRRVGILAICVMYAILGLYHLVIAFPLHFWYEPLPAAGPSSVYVPGKRGIV